MQQVGDLFKQNQRIQNIVLEGFDPVSSGGFTQVPNLILKAKGLSSNAKVVYAQMLAYAWSNDRCYPGQERMAEDIGSTKSTVNRAVIELQQAGWLGIERRGQGKTNIYTLRYVVKSSRIVDKNLDK